MSWWELLVSEGTWSGDAPLDAVGFALEGYADECAAAGAPLASPPELAAAIEAALAGGGAPVRVLARGFPRDRSPPRDELVRAARQAMDSLAVIYQDDHHRSPKLAEVFHAFRTVVGASPEKYLRPPYPDRFALDVEAPA